MSVEVISDAVTYALRSKLMSSGVMLRGTHLGLFITEQIFIILVRQVFARHDNVIGIIHYRT
jgi:hypothetical protein